MALFQGLVGDIANARTEAIEATQTSGYMGVLGRAGIVLALAGDSARAQKIAPDLNQRFPEGTYVEDNYVPKIRAVLALRRGKPQDAIQMLGTTSPYDLLPEGAMIAVYVRGQAYLDAHQGPPAAAEFQKLRDNPMEALDRSTPKLGLARAYALQGDTAKAKTEYQDFLAQWKDADPGVPLRKQAKSEYAKFQ
jgi:eukaryotic-like serine/threonine-protein kinase